MLQIPIVYLVILFLLTGFIVSIYNIFIYQSNIKNIEKFKKLLFELKNILETDPFNIEKVNPILSKLLKEHCIYRDSNLDYSFYYEALVNSEVWHTGFWLANIYYFLSDSPKYPFKELQKKICISMNECDVSIGLNLLLLKKSKVGILPIFYFNNIIFAIKSAMISKNSFISTKTQSRTISFFDITALLANIIAISVFILNLLGFHI